MMPASQNGWPASEDRATIGVHSFIVPDTTVRLPLAERCAPLLLEMGRWWHHNVEPLRPDWCWGYSYRPILGARQLSNHASGTAADFMAPNHPLGRRGTLGSSRAAVIDKARSLGLRSGASYTGRVDEMHVEINVSPARCDELVRALQSPPPEPPPAPETSPLARGSTGARVETLQRRLNEWFPAYSHLQIDGRFGPATEATVREFQQRAGLEPDGIAGPRTLAALGLEK